MKRKVLASFGETDEAGSDAKHLSSPTSVAIRGSRAVIADVGNQRALKVALGP